MIDEEAEFLARHFSCRSAVGAVHIGNILAHSTVQSMQDRMVRTPTHRLLTTQTVRGVILHSIQSGLQSVLYGAVRDHRLMGEGGS